MLKSKQLNSTVHFKSFTLTAAKTSCIPLHTGAPFVVIPNGLSQVSPMSSTDTASLQLLFTLSS